MYARRYAMQPIKNARYKPPSAYGLGTKIIQMTQMFRVLTVAEFMSQKSLTPAQSRWYRLLAGDLLFALRL